MIGLKPENRVVLVFGAIRPYKGVDIALEAFAEVVKEVPEARLIIAGRLWESWERYEKIIIEKNIKDHILKHLHYIDTVKLPNILWRQIWLYSPICDLILKAV